MDAESRARIRDARVAGLRGIIKSRAPLHPQNWRRAESTAGDSRVEEFLGGLGQSLSRAMQAWPETTEKARGLLRDARLAIHSAVDTRFDELELAINVVEAAKAASLEGDLVAVDAALESLREITDTMTALSEAELDAQHVILVSRLDGVGAQLQALPTAVETPILGVVADSPAILTTIAGFGRVIAPISATVADLRLEGAPEYIRSGETLALRLTLGSRHCHTAQSSEEVGVLLSMLEGTLVIHAAREAPGFEPQDLAVLIAADSALRSLLISIPVPAAASAGDYISVNASTVSGQISGRPLRLPVHQGMRFPLRLGALVSEMSSPCISLDARLFVPLAGRGAEVLVYDAEGGLLPQKPGSGHGLSRTRCAAYANSIGAPTLLLADCNDSSRVASFDAATFALRWSILPGDIQWCRGVVALPEQGVAVINSAGNSSLCIHRLSDGSRMRLVGVPMLSIFLAADPVTGAVFGTRRGERGLSVFAWSCTAGGSHLIPQGHVEAAGVAFYDRPLVVVPPAPGKTTSHLVVATCDSIELRVISLPDFTLVHMHRLEGMGVRGLAADPWGGALAVCDGVSKALHVLAWPLPGMPPLL